MAAKLQTADGMEAARILAHPTYDVVPYAAWCESLADRLGLDFGNILTLPDRLPQAMRGVAHEEQRADVARLLAERRTAIADALPVLVERYFAVLRRPGDCDVLAECIWPLVDGLIKVMSDVAVDASTARLVSRVFSQAMGVAQRRTLDAELAGLLAQIRTAHPEENRLRQGSRLAVVVLGRDAMTGTLARSLHAHFAALGGQPLSARPLADVPTHTGVPYIDRVPKADHPDNPAIRCNLFTLEGAEPPDRMRFFGAGPHVCLGRMVTLDLFRTVSAHLSGFETKVQVTAYPLRKDDVFSLPDVFETRVDP